MNNVRKDKVTQTDDDLLAESVQMEVDGLIHDVRDGRYPSRRAAADAMEASAAARSDDLRFAVHCLQELIHRPEYLALE